MKRDEAVRVNFLVGLMLLKYQNAYPNMYMVEECKVGKLYAELLLLRMEISDYLLIQVVHQVEK